MKFFFFGQLAWVSPGSHRKAHHTHTEREARCHYEYTISNRSNPLVVHGNETKKRRTPSPLQIGAEGRKEIVVTALSHSPLFPLSSSCLSVLQEVHIDINLYIYIYIEKLFSFSRLFLFLLFVEEEKNLLIRTRLFALLQTHIHIYIYTHTYIHMYIYVCMYVCL